jgi:homoserine O-acetyltransferase
MDAHNVGRERGSVERALQGIQARTLIIGISTDMLFPVVEQEFLKQHIRGAQLAVINSHYGHDGFLTEYEAIATLLTQFISKKSVSFHTINSSKWETSNEEKFP